MSSPTENTRLIKEYRESLIKKWFADIQESGEWREVVNKKDKLKPGLARQIMHKVEFQEKGFPPSAFDEEDKWGEDYFSSDHWSYKHRTKFEAWVEKTLAGSDGRDMWANRTKEDLGLPLWLPNEPLSKRVVDLIIKYKQKIKSLEEDVIPSMQRDYNKVADRLLEKQIIEENTADRYAAIDEHYMNSTRTLHFNAGRIDDLSQDDLFDKSKSE